MSLDMFRSVTITKTHSTPKGSLNSFLDAVTIWINKPHCVNKRLCGSKIVQVLTADTLDEALHIVRDHEHQNTLETVDCIHTEAKEVDLKETSEHFVVVIRENLPKQVKFFPSLLEAVVYDVAASSVFFYPLRYSTVHTLQDSPNGSLLAGVDWEVTYCFTYLQHSGTDSCVQLSCSRQPEEIVSTSPPTQVTPRWLSETLLPKISNWTELSNLTTSVTSLRLVGVERYNLLYNALKEKYGRDLVKNWTETTNPEKFVYEDIGIAVYLMLLWENDRQRLGSTCKQSFVDLGCGNGLLVYILSKEGHRSLGVDLRRRKIWDTFGDDVKLEERSITPSAQSLFPDYDWIIGNHSDELTPWIPVIAARSSFTCSYFVLPCCHHDFNRRFNKKVKGESNYRSYLTYVAQIGRVCGFDVEEDTLRIPSTKRVCQIGRCRTYDQANEEDADRKRQAFIAERCAGQASVTSAVRHSAATDITDGLGKRTSSVSQSQNCHKADSQQSVLNFPSVDSSGDEKTSEAETAFSDVREPGNRLLCRGNGNDRTSFETAWADNFQARDRTEVVRNCQRVSRETSDRVVKAVFEAVLTASDATVVKLQEGREWRKGGTVELSQVAVMLDTATREELKSECGGVQTLLRNHNFIFQVSGGKVQLRDFSVDNPWSQHGRGKRARRTGDSGSHHKTSLCWFHSHHPDGCPRAAQCCSFAHGEHELRPRDEAHGKKGRRQ